MFYITEYYPVGGIGDRIHRTNDIDEAIQVMENYEGSGYLYVFDFHKDESIAEKGF